MIISINFTQIKSSIFKKNDQNSLFRVTCLGNYDFYRLDITERMNLTVRLFVSLLLSLPSNSIVPYLIKTIIIWVAEIVIK